MSLLDDLKTLKNQVDSGDFPGAWSSFVSIGNQITSVVFGVGAPVEAASDADAAAGVACCAELESACKSKLPVGAGPAGGPKWDGTILKIVLEALPLILSLFKK